jgi:hypothetical protein
VDQKAVLRLPLPVMLIPGDSRSDWFKFVAGNKEVRIAISHEKDIKKLQAP